MMTAAAAGALTPLQPRFCLGQHEYGRDQLGEHHFLLFGSGCSLGSLRAGREAAYNATYQKMMLINLSVQLFILLITNVSITIYQFCHGHGIFTSIHHTLFGKCDMTVR